MIADDISLARVRPWLADNRRDLIRAAAPAVSLVLVWWLVASLQSPGVWLALVSYSVLHLALIAARQRARARLAERAVLGIDRAGLLIDIAFCLLLIASPLNIDRLLYPLYLTIALRVLAFHRQPSFGVVANLLVIPLYLVLGKLLWPLSAAVLPGNSAQWWLIGLIGFGTVAVWSSLHQRRQNEQLRQALRGERQLREARVSELERTTNELRARMRELHALEEGLRVITSSLSLDEVLNQIIDSTVQTLGRERVYGTTLSLVVDGDLTHHSLTRDGSDAAPWADLLATRVMQQQVPLVVSDATEHADLALPLGYRLRSALCVPLFVGDGPPRGALTVVSVEPAAFSTSAARHLAAFSAQAGIAIANAEMHSRLRRQQRLLEAVVRDINDGLVVVDADGQIILTNPAGKQILAGRVESLSVRDRLLDLAASISGGGTEQGTAMCELRLSGDEEEEGSERVYQAFASRVQQEDAEPLVAIVLHDITHHKAEERARTEFISMVSHELRNPLHSLNGFLKVVIQGRAGALTPLQQDFLQMADGQVELLKGRIAELLEFNRIKAGRLTLHPQPNDLSLLVAGTVNRLALQAEQTGLKLFNQVSERLPECEFDSERIGQVLTNLIENAIKATPPGGTITVESELHEGEVWIHVRDTGIGIAPGDLQKIFQRFYRANNQPSRYGNHLGLGLAICQQIIEGHGGRIWVESEVNVGTRFTFSLPIEKVGIAVEAAA